jgi:hypothetical protein
VPAAAPRATPGEEAYDAVLARQFNKRFTGNGVATLYDEHNYPRLQAMKGAVASGQRHALTIQPW